VIGAVPPGPAKAGALATLSAPMVLTDQIKTYSRAFLLADPVHQGRRTAAHVSKDPLSMGESSTGKPAAVGEAGNPAHAPVQRIGGVVP
jgi:hypothetical protein